MNILINYDYINSVKNVNEKLTPFKIIRNNKSKYIKFNLPLFLAVNFIFAGTDLKKIFNTLLIQFGFIFVSDFVINYGVGNDLFRAKSESQLKELVGHFKEANIDTSYELLKKSFVYDKKINFRINENKIPELVQSKYILVPTYDYLGDIKDTSVVQEHVLGSNNYVLSLGKSKKVLKPSFSNI